MKRERWSSRTIFLFAAIGSAVGLGNIWRFPYLTYKFGGGAFLIPYLIALFLLGIPLLMLEFGIGQRFQRGAVESMKKVHNKLGGVGLMAILTGFIVVVYYAVVMAWSLLFLVDSFQENLPWASDSSDYFFNTILNISDGVGTIGALNGPLFFALFAVWFIVYFCVRKGVKSVGKVVAITMPLPIILLIALFIRGITLPGALQGIIFYLNPDFTVLLNTEIWLAAISQIFFTLTLGFGVMIAYASYNKENQDVTSDAFTTAILNSIISLFAGFVVFAVLGYMTVQAGVDISEVATAGPGLAFVVFPQALSLMPLGWLFSIMFFLTLLTLGIDSAFSLVESVDTVITDRSGVKTKEIAFVICGLAFLLGIIFTTQAGLYLLDIVDHFVTNFGLVLVGIFTCLSVGWVYGAENLRAYINEHSKYKLGSMWDHLIKWIIPLILIFFVVNQFMIELEGPYEGYPEWSLMIGWGAVVVPLALAILWGIFAKGEEKEKSEEKIEESDNEEEISEKSSL
jgi:neurotransmitter:Na+ symporter, NSS family